MLVTILSFVAALLAQAVQPAPQPAVQRFDYLVRADFFAGAAGDAARLQKAIDLCEKTLAENPKHPEALVWHGASLLVRGGQAFQKNDAANGMQLFGKGVQEMADAVALAPENPGVLIPRAAVLIEATKSMPPAQATPFLELAVGDYEKVLKIQEPMFPTLGDHPKGELLFGLAEASARLGRTDKARAYFERVINDAPTSGEAPRAKAWIETGSVPKANGLGCVGCHK
jgi:tetratricopeptide (TPR) repeat protein